MPSAMLSGEGAEWAGRLRDMGLQVAPGTRARNLLAQYIDTRQLPERVTCTDRVGWHGRAYVLPRETLGDDGGEQGVAVREDRLAREDGQRVGALGLLAQVGQAGLQALLHIGHGLVVGVGRIELAGACQARQGATSARGQGRNWRSRPLSITASGPGSPDEKASSRKLCTLATSPAPCTVPASTASTPVARGSRATVTASRGEYAIRTSPPRAFAAARENFSRVEADALRALAGDPAALARCHADIATGDIIVTTMLFMEDHIKPVLPAATALEYIAQFAQAAWPEWQVAEIRDLLAARAGLLVDQGHQRRVHVGLDLGRHASGVLLQPDLVHQLTPRMTGF